MNDGRAIYAAAAVERMVGASAATIREWEKLYGIVPPHRSPSGQVLYSRDEVERLRWVAQELAAGRVPFAAAPEAESDAAAHARASERHRPNLLVLLAERDARAAELTEFFLRTEGYRVEVTFSADEASAGAAALRPDVAIVELALDGHSGLRLVRTLRDTLDAPVIGVSSLDCRDEALAAGVAAFLLKPLDPLLLVSTVKDLLGESAYLRSETEQ